MPYRRRNNGLVGAVLGTAFGAATLAAAAAALTVAVQSNLPEEPAVGTEPCESIPQTPENGPRLKFEKVVPCVPATTFPTYQEYKALQAGQAASAPTTSQP